MKPATMDRTHLNPYGQKVFGRMVADEIVKTRVELGPDLIGEPAPVRGRKPSAGAAECRFIAFENAGLFGRQATFGAAVP